MLNFKTLEKMDGMKRNGKQLASASFATQHAYAYAYEISFQRNIRKNRRHKKGLGSSAETSSTWAEGYVNKKFN